MPSRLTSEPPSKGSTALFGYGELKQVPFPLPPDVTTETIENDRGGLSALGAIAVTLAVGWWEFAEPVSVPQKL
jgi:hypothetical protein